MQRSYTLLIFAVSFIVSALPGIAAENSLVTKITQTEAGKATTKTDTNHISVTDDAGREIRLSKPAQRIISLAPHLTEMVFEAGVNSALVGISDYSDYPEQAKKITSVGNIFALDIERLIALKPDLVLVWGTGTAHQLAAKLHNNHLNVFESDPRDFETIATSLERIAKLAGNEAKGQAAALKFRTRLANLRQTYQLNDTQKPVRVFYQIAQQPLMSINKQHIISKAIQLCGGQTIFQQEKELSLTVSTEAILSANPQAIVGTRAMLADWLKFTSLTAVNKGNLFAINEDIMNRAGPRILDGTETLCQYLKTARR